MKLLSLQLSACSIAILGILGCSPEAITTAQASNSTNEQPARVPVLEQVKHPHTYYWREMYAPQLTNGPSGLSFTPDGKAIIYSMAGSLWRQALDSDTAIELTAQNGYDFQPDVRSDNNHVVFVRQQQNRTELMAYAQATQTEHTLGEAKYSYFEPRFSPNGQRIAYVRTNDQGHLGVFVADIKENDGSLALTNETAVMSGHVTEKYRYYYSQADHAVNPSWTPDGKSLLLVTNKDTAWGSGGIWEVPIDNPEQAKLLIDEETTWSATPQLASDGKRLLYASYRGRQFQQLWITSRNGDYPFPITFGEYDIRAPRWSTDDQHLAYISNKNGSPQLVLHEFVGGKTKIIEAAKREYKRAMQRVTVKLQDENGNPLSGRISLLGSDGRHYAPNNAWIHADDYVDTVHGDHETHYFHCHQQCALNVPAGEFEVFAMHGFEHKSANQVFSNTNEVVMTLKQSSLPERFGKFISADFHVHMNYGGQYLQTVDSLIDGALAEDLDLVYNTIVNKEERIPDISQFKVEPDHRDGVSVYQAQEFHTSYWGHLGLVHLDSHYLLPDFSTYWHTGLASPYPANTQILDLAHQQSALTGYVHPFDWIPDPSKEITTHGLPLDVALGKVDYFEVVSFADHFITNEIWYRLLNLGFKLTGAGGTDFMGNYASVRGPIGLNRSYLPDVDPSNPATVKRAIHNGEGFVTNGPLLGFLANEQAPGSTLTLKANEAINLDVSLRSLTKVERLEIIHNGKVVETLSIDENGKHADHRIQFTPETSGWILARAYRKAPNREVQDTSTYATTNPVWLNVEERSYDASEEATYFIAWLDNMKQHVETNKDFNQEWERETILRDIARARKVYEGHLK
ncbi:CehA/McbA family metallohydrolase [Pseudidiomarina marina]|uniref:CehA/McbA family metallohydrolase n=1 Tax=Pseudidiomarina marina TaxID=502366 RepID=UPI00384BD509